MSRRGSGEGLVRQRADGRWEGRISLGYADGKRVRKSVYRATAREVRDKLADLAQAHRQGLPVRVDERTTTAAFLDRWLVDVAYPTLRRRSSASYAELIRVHIAPEVGPIRLMKLSPADVQGLVNRKLASGLSPRTVQYIHAVLRRPLPDAERWGMVPRNVASLVSAPKVPRRRVQPLTPAQARQLLEAIQGDRLEGVVTVALAVGLRQGEAFALRWSDATSMPTRSPSSALSGESPARSSTSLRRPIARAGRSQSRRSSSGRSARTVLDSSRCGRWQALAGRSRTWYSRRRSARRCTRGR